MIGKVISSLLNADVGLTSIVGTKIFPVVISGDNPLPTVVYTVDSITPEYTKSGWADDDCIFLLKCYAYDYASVQSLALAVRKALELKSGTYSGITITKIYMSDQQEQAMTDNGADAFQIELFFNTKIISYG